MKVHISNIYGVNANGNKVIEAQKRIAQIGRELGFVELGLYRYLVESDTDKELFARLDGIMASVTWNDIVLLQLTTGNGMKYESILVNRIKTFGAKCIILLSDVFRYDTLSEFSRADLIVVQSEKIKNEATKRGATKTIVNNVYDINNDINLKSKLLNIVSPFVKEEEDDKWMDLPDEMIHVCFGLHDKTGNYSINVAIVMKSIIDNTDARVCFHILIDETVSTENQRKLRSVTNETAHMTVFHMINPKDLLVEGKNIETYSVGTMFRLCIPKLLDSLKKVIYLDADLLFLKDIRQLWENDISGYALAAVRDYGMQVHHAESVVVLDGSVERTQYFNAGVLVMNLEEIRRLGDLKSMALNTLKSLENTWLPDQDTLNLLFSKNTYFLSDDWNVLTKGAKYENRAFEKCVYHFAGENHLNYENLREWDREILALRHEIYWGKETFEEYFKVLAGQYYHIEKLQMLIKSMGADKKIFFCGNRSLSLNNTLELFGEKSDDKVFEIKEEFFKAIKKEAKGDYVVLYLPEAFDGKARAELEGYGLKYNIDCFEIPWLMTASQGGYIY